MSVQSIYKSVSYPDASQQNDGTDGVPLTLIPARVSRAIPSKKSMRQITFQSGGSSGAGQTSIVSLPFGPGAGYMTAGSAYLSFKFAAIQALGTWGFKGSCPSASALINRLTISAGSTIESINNYSQLCTNVISPFSTSNALNIEAIAAGGFGLNQYQSISYLNSLVANASVTVQNAQFTADPLGTVQYSFTIPIISGLLAGGAEANAIPLELLNSPLQIQCDWSSIAQTFYATQAPTAYAITELAIVYESVSVGEAFTNSVRAAMAAGKFWSIPLSSIISVQTQYTAALSYNMSLNTSSLSAFFYGVVTVGNTQTLATTSGFFTASVGSTAALTDTNLQRRLFLDGSSVYQLPNYNADALLIRELVRSLSGQINPDNIIVPCNVSGNQAFRGGFRGQFYLVSFNCRSFNDASVALSGTPVSTVNLQTIDSLAAAAGDVVTLFAIVDMIAVIDASGAVSLIR
jgi:hypothetical protein